MHKKTVFVGLSGGVDSAVSAALLKKQGYEVVGVFIKTWHPEFLECNEEEERRDAMRVAAHLNIPFLTFDLEDVYKKEVADYMIREYRAGQTPNPDVMCNKEVKFGAFLKKALSMGADYVATGHYAMVKENIFQEATRRHAFNRENIFSRSSLTPSLRDGTPPPVASQKMFSLKKNKDSSKDQSYFLWTLRQEQLKKILFPIGHLKKTEVRKLAKKFNLPVAEKKDSQGICFLGAVDLKEFLKHYIKEKKGKVQNEQGEEIGFHSGVVFHTLGERHGFTITRKSPTDGPYYVVGKDVKKNTLIVSQDKNIREKSTDIFLLKNSSCSRRSRSQVSFPECFCLCLKNTNWISSNPEPGKTYTAQIRYHGEFLPCKVEITGKTKAKVIFIQTTSGLPAKTLVAAGQSIVIYDKDVCLGGGVVASTPRLLI
ncbi:MAG: tRNA-specific 2-thiouridylase MnmA [Candidatus Nomurabacteria bacterium GW2011_GWF1_42_40]|nr:MAG: tRNA-specific 2-thiouridylase MnmA [Candidatus Nomurabacteria bacterium GW2011_GWF1_42_40]